jgi:hypothetical protein
MLRLSPAEGFSRLNEPTNSRMVGNPYLIALRQSCSSLGRNGRILVSVTRGGGQFSPQTANFLGMLIVQANAPGFFRYRFTTASAVR